MNDVRGVCPQGWHVPTDEEWTQLADHLGGAAIAGGKLKSTATMAGVGGGLGFWQAPNTGASNETGFTALAGGMRGGNGSFAYAGQFGCWWSATENEGTPSQAWANQMTYGGANLGRAGFGKTDALSVRCVRD